MEMIYSDNNIIRYRGGNSIDFYVVEQTKKNGKAKIIIDSNILSNPSYLDIFGRSYFNVLNELRSIGARYSDVSFEFRTHSDIELNRVNEIIKHYNIKGKSNIVVSNNSNNLTNESKKEEEKKEITIENYFKAKIITVNNNGRLVNRIVRPKDSVRDEYILDNINIDDLKSELDFAINEDPSLVNLSPEEVAIKVIDRLELKMKKHNLESKDNYSAKSEREEAALHATNKDEKVNTELGVVMKDLAENTYNSFKAVENNGDNYRVVNPNVNEISGNSTSMDIDSNIQSDLGSEEIETRDEETVFYLDNYNKEIYNKDGEKIGNLGSEYMIDYNDNYLVKKTGDKVIKLGPVDDINNLGKSNNKSNNKVRRLEKPKELDNAAFINMNSFVVLITILSIMAIFLYLISK